MSEPDCDYPREAEIQRLIEMRDYEGALGLSLREYEPKIKRKCIDRLKYHVDDPISEAGYLTQKIFYEFYLKMGEYDSSRSSILTFLRAIARFRIMDRLREARPSRSPISYESVSYMYRARELDSRNPEDLVLNQDILELVKRVIANEFTPLVASILLLYFFKGKTVTEIAHDLRKDPNNVRKRLSLARPKFEELMVKLKKEIDRDE